MRVRAIFIIALVWAWMVGCAAQQSHEARVRGALDVTARVVDPAYALAVDGCIAKQSVIATAAEKGELPSVEADKLIADVRARCHQLRAAFEAIRRIHAQAVNLVEQGAMEEAQRRLDEMAELWGSIREGATP